MITQRGFTPIQILALAGGVLLHAADDPHAPPKVLSQVLAFSELVRVAQVNTPSGTPQHGSFASPGGSEPLSVGTVQVTRDRQVAVDLQGATANASYAVAFCRFGFAINAGCVALGQLPTNAGGDGTATLASHPRAAGLT
jgi:hypothetical protein